MSTPSKPSPTPSPLAYLALALASLAPSAAAQAPALAAETYGRASGDAPHPELGLVLELVDPGTPDARLRLFGGLPGHPATIVISAARADAPAGASGAVSPGRPGRLDAPRHLRLERELRAPARRPR